MYPPSPSSGENTIAERILIACGGVLLAASPFATWIHIAVLGDFNLTGLLSAGHAIVAIAYVVTAMGVAVLLVAALARKMDAVRVTALACGSVILLVGGFALYGLIRAVSGSAGLGEVGPGPVMAVVASVLLIVPPLVTQFHRPATAVVVQRPLWLNPRVIPALVAVLIGAAIAWVPYHAGVNNYCGTPVGATFKSRMLTPSAIPPSDVLGQIQTDQAAVASAQQAVDTQSRTNAKATQQQNSADALSAQAAQADNATSNLQSTVSNDQSSVQNDQSTVQNDQSTVQNDQSTVQSDQQTISGDNSTLQGDEQTLAADQQAGNDTSYDQQAIANDQQTLANDQGTLARDQNTLNTDQNTVNTDQNTLNGATSTLADDQKSYAAAQATSSQLDQQAQDAQNSAQNASSSATQANDTAQQQLDTAQQQLATDQQAWQDRYQSELTAAHDYNSALSDCQHQANANFIGAGIVVLLGVALTAALLWEQQRRRPAPPGSPMIPAM